MRNLMPEAVIVATARSPIGRAVKGSLRELRPDDLAAQMVTAALAKLPALDPREINDLMLGAAQPAGEAGYNLGRAEPSSRACAPAVIGSHDRHQ
jgi:acetyl-CoA C-acetyltransferase